MEVDLSPWPLELFLSPSTSNILFSTVFSLSGTPRSRRAHYSCSSCGELHFTHRAVEWTILLNNFRISWKSMNFCVLSFPELRIFPGLPRHFKVFRGSFSTFRGDLLLATTLFINVWKLILTLCSFSVFTPGLKVTFISSCFSLYSSSGRKWARKICFQKWFSPNQRFFSSFFLAASTTIKSRHKKAIKQKNSICAEKYGLAQNIFFSMRDTLKFLESPLVETWQMIVWNFLLSKHTSLQRRFIVFATKSCKLFIWQRYIKI